MICLGMAAMDHIYSVPAMPGGGGKFRAEAFSACGGGMAANAAAAVARLGGRASWWGRLGDDPLGDAIIADLERSGVDCSGAVRIAGARSPSSIVIVDRAGERLVVNFRGAGLEAASPRQLPLAKLSGFALAHADVRWPEGAHALFHAARAIGMPTLLDADVGDPDAIEWLLPLTDHALFSDPALREWGGAGEEPVALERACRLGCRVAGVTRGERGVLWRQGGRTLETGAFPVAAVETVAAGDVFHGAYALAILEGREPAEAMRFASAAAALKCARAGGRAAFPSREAVNRLLAEGAHRPAERNEWSV